MERIFSSVWDGAKKGNDAVRLFHGRGHCFPGLEFVAVDWFSPLLLVSFFKEPDAVWLEKFVAGLSQFAQSDDIKNIVLQYRYLPGAPSESIQGVLDAEVDAVEDGLRFRLNVQKNQNTGFFLDMKNCRDILRVNADGKTVLNLFSYTCAFSVVAANSGAKLVVNMDMSKGALKTGKLNHSINDIDTRDVFFFAHDIFRSWGKIRKYGPYDYVVVDPPSFQRGSFDARKDYVKIVRKLPELLADNGQVIACLNSPELGFDFLRELFDDVGGFQELEVVATPESFPEVDVEKGLKTLLFKKIAHGAG
ncbi:hypothetical protein A9Q99_02085 [Gammaproteobacteria bacterium 45_16_T64]|nr:hypothetical protein A9Q99_02085 [Gammaproteobacteria bacterium 45_16_T64]